jgi:NhaA family Na+:H+ antiporter
MEHGLSNWVTFLVIPIFALANTGIDFSHIDFAASISAPVTLGVMFGLVLGKFIGISGSCWLILKLGRGKMPHGMNWCHITGAAWLGGIGFTMSLFIGGMAFTDPQQFEDAKLGILLSSLIAAILGLAWLYFGASGQKKE